MTKERETNIDLLRIVAMLLIIFSHYVQHGGVALIQAVTVNKFIGLFFSIGGKLGVDIFILISGYFFAKTSLSLSKICKIDLKLIIYSLGITLFLYVTGFDVFSISYVVKDIFPITTELYWFITAYIGLYLISPILKMIIQQVSKDTLLKIVAIGGIIFSIIPTVTKLRPLYSDLIWFIVLYFAGAYINKHVALKGSTKENKKATFAFI